MADNNTPAKSGQDQQASIAAEKKSDVSDILSKTLEATEAVQKRSRRVKKLSAKAKAAEADRSKHGKRNARELHEKLALEEEALDNEIKSLPVSPAAAQAPKPAASRQSTLEIALGTDKGKQRVPPPSAAKKSRQGTFADSSSDSSFSSGSDSSSSSSRSSRGRRRDRSDRSEDSAATSSSSSSSDSEGARRRTAKKKKSARSRAYLKIATPPDAALASSLAFLAYVFKLTSTYIPPGTPSRDLPNFHLGSIFSQPDRCRDFWQPIVDRFEALQSAWPRIAHFILARIAYFNALVDQGYSERRLIRAWEGKGSATMHDVILIQSANLIPVAAPASTATGKAKDGAAKSSAPSEAASSATAKNKSNNGYYCTYCDKSGHSLDYCNSHKKAMAWAAANPPATPAPAPAPAPAPKGKTEKLP